MKHTVNLSDEKMVENTRIIHYNNGKKNWEK